MERNVRMYLIWQERQDLPGTSRVRHFPNMNALNDFLEALDGANVKSVKVLAAMLLEEREE